MKKKLVIIMMLFTIAVGYFLNYDQPVNNLAGNDGADDKVIEWNCYSEGKKEEMCIACFEFFILG